MQLHINQTLLRSRIRMSLVYLFSSLVCLVGGFVVSVTQTDLVLQYAISMPALLVGLILWARNQSYLARWGPRSRQDSVLARNLRGLDHRYHLFAFLHAALPDYLVIGPMGIIAVVPRAVSGIVACYDDRWRHEDRRSMPLRLLSRLSPGPTLGNPTADAQRGIQTTYRYLADRIPPEVQARLRVDAIVVLTHPQVQLSLHGCPVPAVLLRSLRGHIRRLPKVLTPGELAQLVDALPPD